MLRTLLNIMLFEWRLGLRHVGEALYPLGFFVICVTFFPLAFGPEEAQMKALGAGMLWLGVLLGNLLATARLFQRDAEDGMLEQWLIQPVALEYIVLAKGLAHWLLTAIPMLLCMPMVALMVHLPMAHIGSIMLGFFLGSGVCAFLGVLGAALMIDRPGAAGSLMVILMPLYIPILIFGAALAGEDAQRAQALIALGGMCCFIVPLNCFLTAILLRYSQR